MKHIYYMMASIATVCLNCNSQHSKETVLVTNEETKTAVPTSIPQKQEEKKDTVETTDHEMAYTHSVYYYYKYELSEHSRMDDNIVELCYDGDSVVKGFFWGTSDEFDEAREGYYPGFIVLPMEDLKVCTDSIFFVLDSRGKDYFSNCIDVSIHSCEEAKEKGYHPWLQDYEFVHDGARYKGSVDKDSVRYKGTIDKDTIILNDKSKYQYYVPKKFVRTDLEDIKKIERSLSKEEERNNRRRQYR